MSDPKFPPIRACLFDMDGLLIDSEDKYTICTNIVLAKYNKGPLPWSIKAQLQGRPGPAAGAILHNWAQLPISNEDYVNQLKALQQEHFPLVQPLPGVEKLLADLSTAKSLSVDGKKEEEVQKLHIALATSSHAANYTLKTTHLSSLFSVFPSTHRVLGDDPRIAPGRGKPLPDIYLLALSTLNAQLPPNTTPIKPIECLVFEDSVPGVESGRRAGMRVIWCPHPELAKEYKGREADVLAGRTGDGSTVDMHMVGEVGDGWAEYLETLENFPYEKYGIVV